MMEFIPFGYATIVSDALWNAEVIAMYNAIAVKNMKNTKR